MENDEWRLEPEGEAEVPDIIIVSDAVEGTTVDLEGESRHEQVEASFREGEERCSMRATSPKRKVIRVGSEETQDYVRERQYGAEEKQRTLIPSAVGVPLTPLFRCDKQMQRKDPHLLEASVGSGE